MSKSDETFGEVIDLTDVSKARRGAEATYEQGLLDLLASALPIGKAVRVTSKSYWTRAGSKRNLT